jgi:MFS transporter
MSISMRGGQQPYADLRTPHHHPGRHRTARARAASYLDLFAFSEFRALWSSQVLSYVGDQIAQVAVAVLVYGRTGSPWLTALAYSLTYLPAVVGGPLLAGLADRFPGRLTMITLDLARAGLLELMALPRLPLPWLATLLFATVLLGPPFSAARSSLLPQILPRDRLAAGSDVADITFQGSQVGGFLAGGLLVTLLGTHRALALDALSFCLSAGLIARWVGNHPVPAAARRRPSLHSLVTEGGVIIFRRPLLRSLVLFGWLAGFAVVPEGLAAPYARTLGGGALTAGLLMAAMPAGLVLGAALLSRLVRPDERVRLIGWLAMLSCAPLIASLLEPPLWALVPLWTLAGAGGAYQLAVARAFLRVLPGAGRTCAFGTAQAGLLAAQGLGVVVAGAVAGRLGPQAAVGIAGLLGMTTAAALASDWVRQRGALTGEPSEEAPAAVRRQGG